jgi:signal transduction histidine kinase
MKHEANRRILLVDDSEAIHQDFRKILGEPDATAKSLAELRAAFAGEQAPSAERMVFQIDSAFQGEQGLAALKAARQAGQPYALAFVDVRMPPGWDGVETIQRLWEEDPDLQIVVCTAYSDYSWEETIRKLGQSDRLLILKKPFDPIEIYQLASAITEKWNALMRERKLVAELQQAGLESRAYASSLETVNRALETSNLAAARASQMKTDIILHLGEEVQEHLTAVLQRVDKLRAAVGEESGGKAALDSIGSASRHLMRALDEIQDFTLMESGKLTYESEQCSPLEIAREVVEQLRGYADRKRLVIELRGEGPVPEHIHSSPQRIRQILLHLVANAIKYTSEGGVEVVLGMEPTSDWQNSLLRFRVTDSGSGVQKELHGRIFEPFAGRSSTHGGLGLGLALSKRLARLLGGDLKVSSNPGQGTTFTLILQTGNLTGVRMLHA